MMTIVFNIVQIFIGFSSGVIIGGAFVALLTVLGVIARLIQLSKSWHLARLFTFALLFGTLFGTYLSFTFQTWNQSPILLVVWGMLQGIFNGMLAAALIEVLQVFPLLSKRIGMEKYMLGLLTALIFGKIFGSLFQWLVLVKGIG